jgi:hypothetical protein
MITTLSKISYLKSTVYSRPGIADFIPLYFNSANLKDIYVKRAAIMEVALQRGFQLDYVFPPRDKNHKKIRVGVLSNHFTPQPETFATLPTFEYLDYRFKVILYTNIQSGHPLETYCESRVDHLVKLPEDLYAKVQTIRQDDLDIILIGTNVTAVTNQINILALHRLARIQIATFNSPVTTGMKQVDYYLTGTLTAFGSSEHYQETLALINGTGFCFSYGEILQQLFEQYLNNVESKSSDLGTSKAKDLDSSSAEGAELFIQSLGETAQPFMVSLTSQKVQELLTAEQTIAASSLWLTEEKEKLFQYHNNYPNDGYLNLWTGLVRQQHEQHAEAISNFIIAINLGCNHWRVAWYLAQSAEKVKDWVLAENALRAILQVEPNFEPAQEMGRRLTG